MVKTSGPLLTGATILESEFFKIHHNTNWIYQNKSSFSGEEICFKNFIV